MLHNYAVIVSEVSGIRLGRNPGWKQMSGNTGYKIKQEMNKP